MSTNATPPNQPPKLAPPGAGIPLPARLMLRYVVRPLVVKRTPWEVSLARFNRIHEKIKQEWSSLDDAAITTPALIPPLRGLEDSSRYWSISQTARHLTIVGQLIENAVIELSHGRPIEKIVGTADVKPESERNARESIDEYVRFADGVIERIERSVGDRDSPLLLEHPWFGKLRARDWFWLLAIHSNIHLQQIREIKKALTLK